MRGSKSRKLLVGGALLVGAGVASVQFSHVTASVRVTHSCGSGTTYTRIRMSPQPIATFGSLQANNSASFFVQPLNGTACVAGATVYVFTNQHVSGDSISIQQPSECGGATTLGSSPIACTTDSTGKVNFTYTAPASIPDRGTVEVTSQNSSSTHPAFATHTWYLYESVYQFSASPIAPSGSLQAGQSVTEVLSDVGPGGTPQVGAKVFLSTTSTSSPHGSASVGPVALTSSPKAFTTDGSGEVTITYTAASTLPGSGVDTINAGSSTSSTPPVFNSASYAFSSSMATVSVGDISQTEGDADGTGEKGIPAEFDVTLSAPQSSQVTVQYLTICGIGDKGCKEDYLQTLQPTPRTVTFPAGTVSEHINVILYSYSAPEPYDETLYVQLLNPSGAILGRTLGNGLLYGDNESTSAALLYLGDVGVARGASGTQFAEFTVTLSTPQTSAVTFAYSTSPGTATPGTDYLSVSGVATIAANTTFTHIQVPILAGSGGGSPLQFTMSISGSSGPAIMKSSGTGTIYPSR